MTWPMATSHNADMGREGHAPRPKTRVWWVYTQHLPRLLITCLSVLLASCAPRSPDSIRLTETQAISPAQAQTHPGRFDGKPVRWGGNIVAVENRERETRIEVLSRQLENDGHPKTGSLAGARFIARVPGFLDPAEYAADRPITLVGTITGSTEQTIGDYLYRYPVLEAEAAHLWAEPEPRIQYPPYSPWYDPWHHPWYDPWWHRYPR